MKRTRNELNAHTHYPTPKRPCALIDNAFSHPSTQSFTELAELLENSESMEQSQLLLLKLNLEIKNKNRNYPVAFKNSLSKLVSIAFTNIEHVLKFPPEEFYTFLDEQERLDTRKNQPGQSLAFVLYNLGQLADAKESSRKKSPLFPDLLPFSASHLQYLLEIFARLPKQSAKAIGNSFYGLGLLAKARKLRGQVAATPLNILLTKLLTQGDTNPQEISNSLYGLGLLAHAGKLQGSIPGATWQELLAKLLARPDTTSQEISNSLYGLALIVQAGKLQGSMLETTWHNLLTKLLALPDTDSQAISNCLYGFGLLAQARKLQDSIPEKTWQELLSKLLAQPDSKSQAISNSIYGLALIAQAGKLQGLIPATILQELLSRLMVRSDTNSQAISNSLYSLGLLAQARKLQGSIPATTLHELLTKLLAFPESGSQQLSNSLYGLGLLAQAGKLQDSIPATTLQELLTKLLAGADSYSQAICNSLYGLGLLAQTGKLQGSIPEETWQELLIKLLAQHDTISQEISNGFYGLGLLAKAGKLQGLIPAATWQELLSKLLVRPDIDSQSISNSIYGLGLLAQAGKLQGLISATTWHQLLTKLIAFPKSSAQEISNSFYGLGLLAQAGKLQGSILATTLQKLLTELLARPEKYSQNISSCLYGLGLLVKSGSSEGALSHSLALRLLTHLNASNSEPMEARMALKGMTALIRQDKTLLSRALCEQIKALIHTSLSPSYLHPTQAADLINCLVLLKEYQDEFQAFFMTLVEALVTLRHFNGAVQTQLQENVNQLNSVPLWQQVLQQRLGLAQSIPVPPNTAPRRMSRTSTPPPKMAEEQTLEIHTTPTPTRRRPQLIATQPGNTRRNPAIDPEWMRACRNKVFKAISRKDASKLKELLQLLTEQPTRSTATRRADGSRQAPSRTNTFFHRVSSLPKDSNTGRADDLVIEFFTTTPANALRRLVSESESRFFVMVLRACSRHARYQLAQTNALHPLMLYLPLQELTSLIDSLLSLELYRDHQALLRLMDALVIRSAQNPHEQRTIIAAQNTLLQRALAFHRQAKHTHVTACLEVVKTRLVSQTLTLLEEETHINEPVSLIASPLPMPTQTQTASSAPPPQCIETPQPVDSASSNALNPRYEYTCEDIEAILTCRLKKDYPHAHILAGALMNDNTFGNRVVDVLNDYKSRNPRAANEREILFLPIEIGAHWVGLSITRVGNDITAISYFNSKRNSDRDVPLMNTIKHELLEANLIKSDLLLENAKIVMQQPPNDSKSCGVYLVENFYCSLKNLFWAGDNNTSKAAMAMRKRHLEILTEHRPDYVENFLTQQTASATSIPNVTQRQQSHGVSSSQSAFFVNGFGSILEQNSTARNQRHATPTNPFN